MLPNIEEIFELLEKIIDIEKILANPQKLLHTQRYYYWTNYFYRRFHSKKGAMHFPLFLENGAKNHFEGLETQPNHIKNLIQTHQYTRIAEVGYGQGFNTNLLASQLPNAYFTGIDLLPKHQKQAQHHSQKLGLQNTNFRVQDFEKPFVFSAKQEIFFAIESFCYAQSPQKVFENIAQNLKQGGKLVIFDMFCYENFEQLPAKTQQASQLSAIGYAVNHWKKINLVIEHAQKAGFSLKTNQDLTHAVRPNAIRFQKDAINALQKYKFWFKYLYKMGILPTALLFHIIAGAIAPYAWQAQGYFLLEFEKR